MKSVVCVTCVIKFGQETFDLMQVLNQGISVRMYEARHL